VDAETGASPVRIRFGRILDETFNAQSANGEFEGLEMSYQGLAARVTSQGDIFSGKVWLPAAEERRRTVKNEENAPDPTDSDEQ
jgi:hypothetical protein